MRNRLRNISLGIITGIVLCLLLLFILPIDVVYEVEVDTRVYPAKEWKLIQEQGDFRTEEVNLKGDRSSTARTFVFERGDVVDLNFGSSTKDGAFVRKDSLLLQFSSMMHNLRIQRALNEIQIQNSLIIAGKTALKSPLVAEAQQEIERAKSNLALQVANQARLKSLYEAEVISKFEFDQQTNRLQVAESDLRIAEQQLANSSFDEKPEDIAVYGARISGFDKELDVLLAQQGSYLVKAPFDGLVKMNPEEGVVISLRDTSEATLLFPFPIDEKDALTDEGLLVLENGDQTLRLPFTLQDDVAIVRGDQSCLGVAKVPSSGFPVGTIHRATVICDTISLSDYLLRKML